MDELSTEALQFFLGVFMIGIYDPLETKEFSLQSVIHRKFGKF